MVEIYKNLQKQIRRIRHQKPHRVHTIWMKPVSGQLNATQKENKIQAKIPKEYLEFLSIFKEETYEKLLEHRDWDHKILIKRKKETYLRPYIRSIKN